MAKLPFCLCGVRGGHLARRIEDIVANRRGSELTRARRAALALGALTFGIAPVVAGALASQSGGQPSSLADGPPSDVASVTLRGQATLPSFEVASIKRNRSGLGRSMIENVQPSGLWHLTNVPTRALIRTAYRVHDFQIVGAPDWVQTEHYDVVAKASGDLRPVSPGAPRAHFLMLRSFLMDRFKLKAHLETTDAPVFALVMGRADGKPGAGLVPAHDDCAAIVAAEIKGERPAALPGERPTCGLIAGPNRIAGGNQSMSQLATTLTGRMNRMVLDRTGLSGVFNFTLDFVPDGTPIDASQNLPPLQTALREQLGLKLEPARGPVEVLVIDRVERPIEN